MSTPFRVEPITPLLGGEISQVDLQDIDAQTAAALRAAFVKYKVLVFRDQKLTRDQHKAFGRLFGSLHVHPGKKNLGVPGDPEIFDIQITPKTRFANGELWHSDLSCEPQPPLASALYINELPQVEGTPCGGDTMFADMCAAWEMLSEPMQRLLRPLTAWHDGRQDLAHYAITLRPGQTYPQSNHPLIPVHPDSGAPIVFCNAAFTVKINELSARESTDILQYLYNLVAFSPRLQCRVRWYPGTMVLWDNRCVQHHAVWDYYPQTRVGERVTIAGNGWPAELATR